MLSGSAKNLRASAVGELLDALNPYILASFAALATNPLWSADMKTLKTDPLYSLIAESIATAPHELDGFLWCRMSHPDRCSALGIADKTLRRWITEADDIVSQRKLVDGKQTTLLRIGEPGPVTHRHIANQMSKHFRGVIAAHMAAWTQQRQALLKPLPELPTDQQAFAAKRVKRLEKLLSRRERTTEHEFGCMCGLAEVWPEGHQMELFTMVLKRWPIFMQGVKWAAAMEADTGEQAFNRYLEFPHLPVIRRYWKVALEMAEMDAQENGKAPLWLKALNPVIWQSVQGT